MPVNMKIDDNIRLRVISALLEKNAIVPNIRQIQKKTGLHKATIKASLRFLEKKGLIEGYGPKINLSSLGFKLEALVLYQADLSEKEMFDKFIAAARKDPHVWRLSSVIGSGNWNLLASYMYSDVESYHRNEQEEYYKKIPGLYKLIKDKQVFYTTEPNYKFGSRTKAIIDVIKKSKGIDLNED